MNLKDGRFSQIPSTFAIIVVKLDMTGPCEIHPPPLNPSPIRSSMVCRAKIGGRLGGPVGPSAAHGGLRQVPNMVMVVMMTMTLTMTKTKLIIVLIMIVIVLCSFYIFLLYNIIYDIRLLYIQY